MLSVRMTWIYKLIWILLQFLKKHQKPYKMNYWNLSLRRVWRFGGIFCLTFFREGCSPAAPLDEPPLDIAITSNAYSLDNTEISSSLLELFLAKSLRTFRWQIENILRDSTGQFSVISSVNRAHHSHINNSPNHWFSIGFFCPLRKGMMLVSWVTYAVAA